MVASMHAVRRSLRAPRLALLLALAALGPAACASATTQPAAPPKFPIPASERVHGATAGAPATSVATTPAGVKAASGAAAATAPAVTTPAAESERAATTALP